MIPKQDDWSIVIVGFWNVMIFSPNWIGQKIFEVETIETLVPMQPKAPVLFRTDDVALSVDDKCLILNIRKSTDACINTVERMAYKILEELPETPITAIGTNFVFKEPKPDDNFLKIFNYIDDVSIGSTEWEIKSKKLTRKLVKNSEILNVTLLRTGTIEIHGNFHIKVKSAREAKEAIEDKVVNMKDTFLSFLSDVYNLSLDQES